MNSIVRLVASLAVTHLLPCSAEEIHAMSLGRIDIRLVSRAVSETNSLLTILLSTTAHFLDASFLEVDKVAFQKVACSIDSYELGAIKDDRATSVMSMYEANVTITGHAYFNGKTEMTQRDLMNLSIDAFEADNSMFLRSLLSSANPFLANLEHALVTVNGDRVAEKNADDGFDSGGFFPQFPMWMVAVIAGGMAFVLVLCMALACYCCCNLRKESMGVVTKQTAGTSYLEDDIDDKTPSPTRSITSQDSSVFTYNPKTSRTANSYFSSSNFSYEGDVEWHQNPMMMQSKDLSLIEEGSEVSSEQSTPRQLQQKLDLQNFKSLLKKPDSFEEDDDREFNSLTENALREIEWNAENDDGVGRPPSRWEVAASKKTFSFGGGSFDVYGDSSTPQKPVAGLETVDFGSTDLVKQMENLYGEHF